MCFSRQTFYTKPFNFRKFPVWIKRNIRPTNICKVGVIFKEPGNYNAALCFPINGIYWKPNRLTGEIFFFCFPDGARPEIVFVLIIHLTTRYTPVSFLRPDCSLAQGNKYFFTHPFIEKNTGAFISAF